MTNMFWAMHSVRAANEAASTANRSAAKARDARTTAKQLENRVDQLVLVCMAMWSLLREKTDLSEEDLAARVQQIDLQDGSLDGKVKRELARCSHCGRTLSRRHVRCLYCGTPRDAGDAFDTVM